jgi:hypothetical protein
MKSIVVIAIAVGVIAAFEAAAQEERPVTSVVAVFKKHIAAQCALSRERMSSSTQSFAKEEAAVLVKMNCDCLPSEIERVATDLSAGKEQATTTQAAFLSRMKVAVTSCAAKLSRADAQERCEGENKEVLGVSDKKAYCGCVSERLNALDDDAIVTADSTAYRNFQDKVQAKMKGQPPPTPVPTVFDGIEKACKQAGK